MAHHIVLYSKAGCHLCEITHQLLQGLQHEFELTIEEVDIEGDLELNDRYWDKIPVLLIDERTTLSAPIRIAEVRKALRNS